MKKTWKISIGFAIWIVLVAIVSIFINMIPQDKYNAIREWTTVQSERYFSSPLKLRIIFDDWIVLRSGDKVYLNNSSDEITKRMEIGTIYKKTYDEDKNKWVLYTHVYPEHKDKIGSDSNFRLVSEPGSSSWVVSKLLPSNRRKELLSILEEYMRIHTKDIQEQLLPIITEVTKESYDLLQKNFAVVMEKNREKLLKKLKDAEKKHLNKEVQELWDKVIWPIVLEESDPVIAPIVEELWGKFPKTKIVMLWIYQSLPGTDNDHVQKKIEDYLQDKAVPIVEDHKAELAELFVTISKRLSKNDKVKQSVLKMFKSMFTDKDLVDLIKSVFIELYKVNKDSFATKLKQKWNDPQIQAAFTSVSKEFEPYLIKVINHVLIDENREIRTELAQVLRRQILYKDKYYLNVTHGTEKIDSTEELEFEGF